MKQFIKHRLLTFIAGMIDMKTLMQRSDIPLIHVFYHTVSDEYLPHIHPLYSPKSVSEFKKDIDFLLKYFNPIEPEEIINLKNEKRKGKPAIHFSFDDGLRGVYEIIAPILFEKGIPATLFINSGFVDNKDLFYRHKAALIIDFLQKNKVKDEIQSDIEQFPGLLKIEGKSIRERLLKVSYFQQDLLEDTANLLGIDFALFLKKEKPYMKIAEIKELQQKGFLSADTV